MTSTPDDPPPPPANDPRPPSPDLEQEVAEVRRELQTCILLLQRCARNVAALERRLYGLQQAHVRSAVYSTALLLVEPLTQRELAVLRLAAQGLTNRAIGCELGLKEGSIKNNMTGIMAKLSARNRREAIARAQMLGLI